MSGRPNQKLRTRKALLEAAARLAKRGDHPSLEEIAEAALVSRATAYRYFASVDALLAEAAVEIDVPADDVIFHGAPADPVERVLRVDTALHDLTLAHESELRAMLAHTVNRVADSGVPPRQNRRTPLIDKALALAKGSLNPAALKHLRRVLAFLIGTEAIIVAQDVLQISDAEARKAKAWAIRALIEAAKS